MKVAFVNQPLDMVFPPYQNSLGIWTFEVSKRLACFCEVVIYSRGPDHPDTITENSNTLCFRDININIDLKMVKLLEKISDILPGKSSIFGSFLYHFVYALKVALDLRKQRVDIVHIYNYSQFAPIIRFFNPGVKIVLNMRCEWLTQLNPEMIDKRLKKVDLVIGVSNYIIDKIKRKFPDYAKICRTVYNGVDVQDLYESKTVHIGKGNTKKQILFVGRISPEKGIHVLLEAFRKVVKSYPDVELKLMGPKHQLSHDMLITLSDDENMDFLQSFYNQYGKSYSDYLQRLIKEYHLEDKVLFLDYIPFSEINNYYRQAYMVVNPSFSESFGRSLIEAMACQVPVVASRIGGMKEVVVDKVTGIFFEPGNSKDLAEAILFLLENDEVRETMAKAATKSAAEVFSWEKVTEKLLDEYKSVLEL